MMTTLKLHGHNGLELRHTTLKLNITIYLKLIKPPTYAYNRDGGQI